MKYICNSCGSESLRWSGKCSVCNEWGTLEELSEEVVNKDSKVSNTKSPYRV